MRPARPSRTAITLVLVSAALWGVARTTGSGWIVVVISVASGLVAAGAVLPAVALRHLDLEVEGPRDATAGKATSVVVAVRGPALRLRMIDPPGPWRRAAGGQTGRLELVPERRGVVEVVGVEAECAAPLGLVWWRARRRMRLDPPMVVGPAVIDHDVRSTGDAGPEGGEVGGARAGEGDVTRGARPYRPGDPVRLLHWPATARRGVPMVKDLEHERRPAVVVAVDLSGDAAEQDVAAGRAAGACHAALAAGRRTVLLTVVRDRVIAEQVHGPREVARRLAWAQPAPPAAVPGGLAGAEIVVVRAADPGAVR